MAWHNGSARQALSRFYSLNIRRSANFIYVVQEKKIYEFWCSEFVKGSVGLGVHLPSCNANLLCLANGVYWFKFYVSPKCALGRQTRKGRSPIQIVLLVETPSFVHSSCACCKNTRTSVYICLLGNRNNELEGLGEHIKPSVRFKKFPC